MGDSRRYWAFIQQWELPQLLPKPCLDQVRAWGDWAPWGGMMLQSVEAAGAGADVCPTLDDPLPFSPIVPDETPGTSQLVSRDDPLADILKDIAMDAVLERYRLSTAEKKARPTARGLHC